MSNTTEDYSAFSMESINASVAQMRKEILDAAFMSGLSSEAAEYAVNRAWEEIIRKVADTNGFREPNRQD